MKTGLNLCDMKNATTTRRRAVALVDRERLTRRRTEAGMSQVELSKASGVSQTQISGMETGQYGASPRTLAALAEALGCKIADLLRPETA